MIDKIVRIYTGSQVDVNLLEARLEAEEIGSLTKDNYNSGLSAGFASNNNQMVDVYVEQVNVEKAKKIVEDLF